jgi:hypothetical protein
MEHRMRNTSVLKAVVATAIVLGFSVTAHAQSEPQKIEKTTPAQSQKPASKPHKVWTEDNLSTVRTPADTYIEVKDRQAASTATAASGQAASEKQPAANSQKPSKTPPLSHAKSVEDADFKIGWEKRDIQGQEEYLATMQQRLDQAPPDQKEHIQKLIEQHKQILADTQNELKGLEDQKKDFQKNPAGQAAAAQPQPPSQ